MNGTHTGDNYRAKEGEPFGQPGFLLAVGLGIGSKVDPLELQMGKYEIHLGQLAYHAAKVMNSC